MMAMPQRALSVRQPWAWCIAYGFKDVENRDWRASNPGLRYRGPALLHAGLKEEKDDLDFVFETLAEAGHDRDDMENHYREHRFLGGIVGVMEIVDVVTSMESPWFFGPRGLVIRNARPLAFAPCKGALGFFSPEIDFTTLKAA